MSKFDNAFSGTGSNGSGNSEESAKRFAELQQKRKELVEFFGTSDKSKSRVGIVSGIIDLGIQAMPDAEVVFNGDANAEALVLEKDPTIYFKDGIDPQTQQPCRLKCWKQKAQQGVAITVDFPQFKFDWGGDIGVKPVRMLLNGEFTPKGMKPRDSIVGRIYDLKQTTVDFNPNWSLSKKGILYKLALAANVINDRTPFTRDEIGKLIGKPALFEVRIWEQQGFFNERITFKSEVPEGMSVPEWNEDDGYFVRFDTSNEESAIKQLRKCVKNTIARSKNYVGSQLHKDFDALMFGETYSNKGEVEEEKHNASEQSEHVPSEDSSSGSNPEATPSEDYELPF